MLLSLRYCHVVYHYKYPFFLGHLGILGWQFDVTQSNFTSDAYTLQGLAFERNGQDITNLFKRDNSRIGSCNDNELKNFTAVTQQLCLNETGCPLPEISPSTFDFLKITNTSKKVGFDWDQLANLSYHIVIDGNVLNLGPYIEAHPKDIEGDRMDKIIRTVLETSHKEGGKDATRLFFAKPSLKKSVKCLVSKYYAGNIDKQTIGCFTSQLFLYVSLTVILGIVLVRFFMACVFDWFISHRLAHRPKSKKPNNGSGYVNSKSAPWKSGGGGGSNKGLSMDDIGNDLFTVLLVTCYSEDEAGIRCTCESMAATDYPDDRKLLFLICDGIIVGSGNDKSTPDICVDLMEIGTYC